MTIIDTISDNIRSSISFHKVSPGGFHEVKCKVCNDHKVRAGFKFESDSIIYNCFRGKCDATSVYTEGEPLSNKFKTVLEAFDVEIPVEALVRRKKPKAFEKLDEQKFTKHRYEGVELLDQFEPFDTSKHYWLSDLIKQRRLDFRQNLFVGTENEWKNRLIVPFMFNGTIIGWEGIGVGRKRYIRSTGNTDMLYINNDKGVLVDEPFIVEGVLDAASIPNFVSVFGGKITKRQAYILRHKKPIIIPDRHDSQLIKSAKRYGWRVSIPEWKENDVNDAVVRYGRFVVARMIHDGVCSNMFEAETRYKIWKK